MLLALDALAKASPQLHLTLVGEGMERAQLDKLLAARGLEGRVHWSGERLPWMVVRDLYREHDALLFSSLRDSFGSQLLEAMSQGLPIIALSLGGARDFLPADGAIKVAMAATAEETAQRMAEALELYAAFSMEKRKQMSAAMWRTAQTFRWEGRAARMVEMMTQIMIEGAERTTGLRAI